MNEVWKDIEGYEGIYRVSNLGRVKSLDRLDGSGAFRKSRLLKLSLASVGYFRVNLCAKGKYESLYVHRLVAKAFIPNIDNKPSVNHIDGNKKNNSINNLEWVTPKENTTHAISNGLMFNGVLSNLKLSPMIVIEIKKRLEQGESRRSIANSIGVSFGAVRDIDVRRSWKHIEFH